MRTPFVVASFLFVLLFAASARGQSGELRLEPYSVERADGSKLDGELGRIAVPEDRARPDGARVELAFVRFRTANPKPAAPIVYLVGGPGPSGVEHCVARADGRVFKLLDHADVIGIDQRGTGRSRPNLSEGPRFEYELPLERAVTRAEYVAAYCAAAARCAAHWKAQGVDLGAYDTRASAEDVDAVRRALGLERIQLWGESYGTHLGLAYLRAFPAHVERATFLRVEGPDDTLKLPSTTQRHLELLARLVADDPTFEDDLPDLVATVRALLAGLAAKPVTVEALREGQKVRVTLGPWDLQHWLANALGLAFEFRDVPAHVKHMVEGDWSVLAARAISERRGELGSAMAVAMDCASGASTARRKRIAAEAADPANLLGDAVNVPFPDLCSTLGAAELDELFRAPFRCDVPVLLVSGSLDARTPPENVAVLAPGFPNRVEVLARNAGHESIEFLDADFRALVAEFLHGRPTASRTIELPPARFRARPGR